MASCLRSAQSSLFCIMTPSCQRSAQRVARLTKWAKVACLQFVMNLFVLFERNIIITLVYMEYNQLVYIVWKYNSPKNGVLTCLWCLINIISDQKNFFEYWKKWRPKSWIKTQKILGPKKMRLTKVWGRKKFRILKKS